MEIKKFWILPLIALLIVGLAAAGYLLFTTLVNVNVTEGQEIQYYDWETGNWENLPLDGSQYIFPDLEINAGDYYDIEYKANNVNKRPIMYVFNFESNSENVEISFVCITSGIKYYEETTAAGKTIYVFNPAESLSNFATRITVNGGTPIGEVITITSTFERDEPANLDWNECL